MVTIVDFLMWIRELTRIENEQMRNKQCPSNVFLRLYTQHNFILPWFYMLFHFVSEWENVVPSAWRSSRHSTWSSANRTSGKRMRCLHAQKTSTHLCAQTLIICFMRNSLLLLVPLLLISLCILFWNLCSAISQLFLLWWNALVCLVWYMCIRFDSYQETFWRISNTFLGLCLLLFDKINTELFTILWIFQMLRWPKYTNLVNTISKKSAEKRSCRCSWWRWWWE